MKNYQTNDIGEFFSSTSNSTAETIKNKENNGKIVLKSLLNLTCMEISINKTSPGTGMELLHRHKNNEEITIFIKGSGEMEIDKQRIPVSEGTVVRVDPVAKRALWNTGKEDLIYFVAQAPVNSLTSSILEDGERLNGGVTWIS